MNKEIFLYKSDAHIMVIVLPINRAQPTKTKYNLEVGGRYSELSFFARTCQAIARTDPTGRPGPKLPT